MPRVRLRSVFPDLGDACDELGPPIAQRLVDRLDHQEDGEKLEPRFPHTSSVRQLPVVLADRRWTALLQIAQIGRERIFVNLAVVSDRAVTEDDGEHELKQIRLGETLERALGHRLLDRASRCVGDVRELAFGVPRQERTVKGPDGVEVSALIVASTADELGGDVLVRREKRRSVSLLLLRERGVLEEA
jgi:hypothetical protein